MRELNCLRCGAQMQFGMQQKFQMGEASFLFGDWPHWLAGSLELEIWFCADCGKVEFFVPGSGKRTPKQGMHDEDDPEAAVINETIDFVSMDGMPQKKCPVCGRNHDFDYPKCPYCNHNYYA